MIVIEIQTWQREYPKNKTIFIQLFEHPSQFVHPGQGSTEKRTSSAPWAEACHASIAAQASRGNRTGSDEIFPASPTPDHIFSIRSWSCPGRRRARFLKLPVRSVLVVSAHPVGPRGAFRYHVNMSEGRAREMSETFPARPTGFCAYHGLTSIRLAAGSPGSGADL
jgi:hypothetical protein